MNVEARQLPFTNTRDTAEASGASVPGEGPQGCAVAPAGVTGTGADDHAPPV